MPVTTKPTLSPDLQVDILQHLDSLTRASKDLDKLAEKLALSFPGLEVEVEVRVGKGREK